MDSSEQLITKYTDVVTAYNLILKSIKNDPETFTKFRYESVRVLENIQSLFQIF